MLPFVIRNFPFPMAAAALVLALLACIVTLTHAQYLTIPSRYPGIGLGNPAAPIRLEEFGDYQCPDCGMAYPIVQQVLELFPPNTIYYIFHCYPLWLHRQAYDAAKAAAVVATTQNATTYWKYVEFAFANQQQIFNAVFYNKTEADLINLLAGWAGQFGVPYATFISDFTNSTAVQAYVGNDIGLGIANQVFGTPTFFINGYKSEFDETTTVSEWVTFFKSLLNPSDFASERKNVR